MGSRVYASRMTGNLMGTAEIRHRLGDISRQRVHQLTQRSDWPSPHDRLLQGRVWKREDVEHGCRYIGLSVTHSVTEIPGTLPV
jgi:prophage regulatory protein